jgi:lipopolysaccharide/colanic/teichoic acid biosynthesis glycosyltransferase
MDKHTGNKLLTGFIIDSIIVLASYYFLEYYKTGAFLTGVKIHTMAMYFYFIWIIVSVLTKKYRTIITAQLSTILASNMVIMAVLLVLIRNIGLFAYYRFPLIYTVLLASIIEFLLGLLYVNYYKANKQSFYPEPAFKEPPKGLPREAPVTSKEFQEVEEILADTASLINLEQTLIEETDSESLKFLKPFLLKYGPKVLLISTATVFNILNQPKNKYLTIINLKRVNDFQYINKFFEAVNQKLEKGGIFIDWVETYSQRKKRILSKFPFLINQVVYLIDFLFGRVAPKLPVTKKIYFFITRGRNRLLSKAETFGRLYSCGFEIITEQTIQNRLFFIVRKINDPVYDDNPTYGPIVKLKRIGKGGKIIGVYKLRTMHAYSEYLQGYIYDQNYLQEGGKFKNDFRITTLGRLFRRLWIDELPMLINLFKGDLKLIGVRPLSEHYFSLYTDDLKKRRLKYKPGLIPPFYADLPRTLEDIILSELRYLDAYDKNHLLTDTKYFLKAIYNIIFKNARSN